ncbi:MAG: hypothetical protein NXY57DRAFT_196474 [Lentinula lateritia]|nr:MAG: hypothetical protein NXY57DRAFT_196474 [Lentinula lateritia]
MQLYYFVALAAFVAAVSATSASNLQRRITDPGNCPNLNNCPPDGGADSTCSLEQPCRPHSVELRGHGTYLKVYGSLSTH